MSSDAYTISLPIQDSSAARSRSRRTLRVDRPSLESLREEISNAIELVNLVNSDLAKLGLPSSGWIEMSARRGTVHVVGEVSSFEERDALIEYVRRVPGVVCVISKLAVSSTAQAGSGVDGGFDASTRPVASPWNWMVGAWQRYVAPIANT